MTRSLFDSIPRCKWKLIQRDRNERDRLQFHGICYPTLLVIGRDSYPDEFKQQTFSNYNHNFSTTFERNINAGEQERELVNLNFQQAVFN